MTEEYISPCEGCHNEPRGPWCKSCSYQIEINRYASEMRGEDRFERDHEEML